MNAQTVNELKSAVPPSDSLWTFLSQIPFTMEAQMLYMMVIGGIIGTLLNYVTRWAKGEIKGGLVAYMFIDNPRRSLLSAITLMGALVAELSTGVLTPAVGVMVNWGLIFVTGFKSGYMIDNIVNKAERPQWTPEQRESVRETPDSQAIPTAVLPLTGDSNEKK